MMAQDAEPGQIKEGVDVRRYNPQEKETIKNNRP